MIPQIIVIVFMLYSIGAHSYNYGTTKNTKDFWTSILSVIILAILLIWGGFFSVFSR